MTYEVEINRPTSPHVNFFLVMIIAMINGLITSIIFESIILRIKEGYTWLKSIYYIYIFRYEIFFLI